MTSSEQLAPEYAMSTNFRHCGVAAAIHLLVGLSVEGVLPCIAGDTPSSVPGAQEFSKSWRSSERCGQNALYLYLRARGWQGKLRDLGDRLELGDRGVSMSALRHAANDAGYPSVVVRADMESLQTASLPVIVHLENPSLPYGHYALFLGRRVQPVSNENVVVLVDPNEASKYEMPIGEFQRYWSSYALAPVANDGRGSLTEVALCILGAVIIAYALFRLVRRTGARLECADGI